MKDLIKKRLKESLEVIPESSIIDIENVSPDADRITNTMVLPYVKDLFYGINKIMRGDFDKLKATERTRIKTIFPKLLSKKTDVKKYKTGDSISIEDEFSNIYTVKKIKGGTIPVSIAFYYDEEDTNTLTMICGDNDVICINIAQVDLASIYRLKNIIRHELIHIADPKVSDEKVFSRLDKKYSASTSDDAYHKIPYEFDTFTHEIISTVGDNFKLIKDPDYKKYMQAKLWELLTALNTLDYSTAFNEYIDTPLPNFFIRDGLKLKRKDVLNRIFGEYTYAISSWSKKPTLFKTFLKRMARVVPYTKI